MYNLEHELDKGITSLAIEGVSVDKSEKEFTKSFLEHDLDSDDLIRELTKYYKSYALGIDPLIIDSLLDAYLDLVNWDCIDNLKKDLAGKNGQDEKLSEKYISELNLLLCSLDIATISEITEEYGRFIKKQDHTNPYQFRLYDKVISKMVEKYV